MKQLQTQKTYGVMAKIYAVYRDWRVTKTSPSFWTNPTCFMAKTQFRLERKAHRTAQHRVVPMTAGLRVSDIATAVRGAMEGNGELQIEGAAGLDEATERHISFFSNPKYSAQLETTKAAAIILPQNTNGLKTPTGKNTDPCSKPAR